MRLNDITSNFLGFSKPAPLVFKAGDINGIVRATVELIRQEATDRNIEVILVTDENIPPMSLGPFGHEAGAPEPAAERA